MLLADMQPGKSSDAKKELGVNPVANSFVCPVRRSGLALKSAS